MESQIMLMKKGDEKEWQENSGPAGLKCRYYTSDGFAMRS
jgi:hypothetical protein